MSRLQAHLIARLPKQVQENTYLAVGSTNDNMRSICEGRRYDYVGAYVMHAFTADPAPTRRWSDDAMWVHDASSDDSWAFLTGQSAQAAVSQPRLLLPGRFYAFRPLTSSALKEKAANARLVSVHDSRGAVCALFVQYDNDMTGWPTPNKCRFYLSYLPPSATEAQVGAALEAFAASRPRQDESGIALTTVVIAGPYDDSQSGAAGDVEPRMAAALAGAGFERSRDTHLRVYRVPP